MKVVFMGTPDFAVPTLKRIHESKYNIPLVITQPDRPKGRGKKLASPPVKVEAEKLGIKVLQPENVNTKETIELLESISPDVIVVVAYGQILKEEILNLPKYGCINVHASLLPYYRGAAPINWAIINGEKKTGITTMYMDKGLDTGDMLLKKEILIGENETAGQLHDRLKEIGAELLVETLHYIEKGQIERTPQDNSIATYAPILNKSIGKINWEKTAVEIHNLVRGLNPWPCAYFEYNSMKVKVFVTEVCKETKEGNIGQVVKVNNEGIYVSTAKDCLVIKELQFPNKKRMKVSEYLKGNEFPTGIILK